MKFRKKPVVIDAVQWNGAGFPLPVPGWLAESILKQPGEPGCIIRYEDRLCIYTLEGPLTARPNDWIIRGVKGEMYPCKPDIFDATYEPTPNLEPRESGE